MKRSVDQDGGSEEKKACIECASSAVNQLVRPSQVPEYLRQNEFFKSLNIEDDEEFHVPAKCMKTNTTVETFQDACDLLESVRFWGANVSLSQVVQIAVMQPLEEIEKKLIPLSNEFLFLEPLMCFMSKDGSSEERMEAAMASVLLEVVQYMEKVFPKFTMQSLACAAAEGHANCLQYALGKELTLRSFEDIGCVVMAAVVSGRFDCLKLLFKSPLLRNAYVVGKPPSGSHWCKKIAAVASEYGQRQCLQFLNEAGFEMGKSILKAAANGHLDCLKYIVEADEFSLWTVSDASKDAAMHDRIECLRYLHGVGGSLGGLQGYAILSRLMRCLQYIHEQGVPWDPKSCDTAEYFDGWDSFFKAFFKKQD